MIADEGKSVLFSTHHHRFGENRDHITFLNQGQVVFSLPKDELLDRYALVKGGLDILSHPEAKGRLLGVRKGQASFCPHY